MNRDTLQQLLQRYKGNDISQNDIIEALCQPTIDDLEHTKLDLQRELRNGYPEVIYGESKTIEQLHDIISTMMKQNMNILATRIDSEKGKIIKTNFPNIEYHALARCLTYSTKELETQKVTPILIVTAGTSDLAVAEEAKITANSLGHNAKIISDVGVAGIHRLFSHMDTIRQAKVVVVIAGMEGALASVMGGLIDAPLIAVPTSIGYGANFGGISALLGMLSSCANGITVTNIDNGYGAAYAACKILNMSK